MQTFWESIRHKKQKVLPDFGLNLECNCIVKRAERNSISAYQYEDIGREKVAVAPSLPTTVTTRTLPKAKYKKEIVCSRKQVCWLLPRGGLTFSSTEALALHNASRMLRKQRGRVWSSGKQFGTLMFLLQRCRRCGLCLHLCIRFEAAIWGCTSVTLLVQMRYRTQSVLISGTGSFGRFERRISAEMLVGNGFRMIWVHPGE